LARDILDDAGAGEGEAVNPRHPSDVAPTDDRYLSLRELSKYAGISVRTLRKYVAAKVSPLPHFRVNGLILVKQSEFDRWMLRFREESTHDLGAMVDDVMAGLR
jgi:excisionase family DNA binding protein